MDKEVQALKRSSICLFVTFSSTIVEMNSFSRLSHKLSVDFFAEDIGKDAVWIFHKTDCLAIFGNYKTQERPPFPMSLNSQYVPLRRAKNTWERQPPISKVRAQKKPMNIHWALTALCEVRTSYWPFSIANMRYLFVIAKHLFKKLNSYR